MRLLSKTSAVSNAGFLLVFPAFYFWHFAQAAGYTPVEIGFYGEAAAVMLCVFAVLWLRILYRINGSPLVGGGFMLLILWAACWTALNWNGWGGDLPAEAYSQARDTILSWVVLFSIGLFLDLDSVRFRQLVFASLIAAAVISVTYIDPESLMLDVRRAFGAGGDVASYQGFARSILYVCFFCLAVWRDGILRVLAMAFCVALLFAHGARSELFGAIAAISALEIITSVRRPLKLSALLTLGLLGTAVLAYNLDVLSQSRQFQVSDLSASTSWLARQKLTLQALEQIEENPISGLFGGHFLVEGGGKGKYAHNALSAWVSFGLLGFIAYVGVTVAALFKAAAALLRRHPDPLWKFAFYVNMSSAVLIVAAKPVFWPMVALGWGLTVNAEAKDRAARKQRPTSASLQPAA